MGIRSDVFLAVKTDIASEFNEKFGPMLREEYGAEVFEHAEGTAYFMDYVKWYHDIYDDLVEMYRWLDAQEDDENYIIIQACSEYPEDHNEDLGAWDENPWGACRVVSVSIQFDREGSS